ncbi:MAG: hypothetical protein K2Q18_01530, partial [Bdellovibrionales bacterium]|nr:hypothetical protein [Bdellovibrionales bacterium]
MRRLSVFIFITFTTFLQNCDNNITISDQADRYVTSVHLTPITQADHIPLQVKKFLIAEKLFDKDPIKFPLAYYLIQADDIKVFYSKYFDPKIVLQLYIEVSGKKYYKLFVHPDVDYSYSFLKHAYRYVSPDYSEFFATPSSAKKTLVVWSKEERT